MHPYWHEDALIDFAIAQGIYILNYAPLAVGAKHGLLRDPAVLAVAAAHAVTPAQAVLRWGLQRTRGSVLPRSTNATHMRDNLNVTGALTDAEMAALSVLPQNQALSSCFPKC